MAEPEEPLVGGWNFRDVAGNIPSLRPGRLLRSAELSGLDDAGIATLARLGLDDVADLRSDREVARRGPSRVPVGVQIHRLPFLDQAGTGADESVGAADEAPHETAFRKLFEYTEDQSPEAIEATAATHMLNEYRDFPTRPGAHRALREVFSLLGQGRTVLAHCFAGKDRTGFVVAAVLEAIGIERDAIIADYLLSNDAVATLRTQIMEVIHERAPAELTPEVVTFTEARLSNAVLGVQAEYLEAAWQTIDQTYGSLESYLGAAGITADDVELLRGALLV